MSTKQMTIDQKAGSGTGSADAPCSGPVTIIEPQRGWVGLDLGELWRYRDLVLQLVQRDFSARYRQTVLGIAWAVINPLLQMMIYTLVFGRIAKFDTGEIPYPVFVFAGLLPWIYFSGCLSQSGTSAVRASAILTKVYFPRLILPLTTITNGLIDFGIQFVILLAIMAWYGIVPTPSCCCPCSSFSVPSPPCPSVSG